MKPLLASLGFFTRLPVPTVVLSDGSWPRMVGWAPVSGWLLGGLSAGAALLATWLWGPLVGGVLCLVVHTWATGGLHLDGLSDCVDGLLCNGDQERTLQVMRDPHAGGLGAAWTALWLLLRAAVTVRCLELDPVLTFAALVFGATWARSRLAPLLQSQPAATPGRGLAASLSGLRSGDSVRAILLFAPALALALALRPDPRWALALVLTLLGERLWLGLWRARIGGVTGDVLGALVQGIEVLTLAVVAAQPTS